MSTLGRLVSVHHVDTGDSFFRNNPFTYIGITFDFHSTENGTLF